VVARGSGVRGGSFGGTSVVREGDLSASVEFVLLCRGDLNVSEFRNETLCRGDLMVSEFCDERVRGSGVRGGRLGFVSVGSGGGDFSLLRVESFGVLDFSVVIVPCSGVRGECWGCVGLVLCKVFSVWCGSGVRGGRLGFVSLFSGEVRGLESAVKLRVGDLIGFISIANSFSALEGRWNIESFSC
jgi:hypothetical protein